MGLNLNKGNSKEINKNSKQNSEQENKNTISPYEYGISFLKNKGYLMVPDFSGKFGKHKVYTKKYVKNLGFEELDCGDYQVWSEISSEEKDEFRNTLNELVNKGESLEKFWGNLLFKDKMTDPLANMALEELESQNEEILKSNKIRESIDLFPVKDQQDEIPIKFIPPLEWFPDNIKELSIYDILSIFPKWEAKMVALLLARAMLGKGNSVDIRGIEIPKHTFRSAGVILGQPGVGKSSLMNRIITSMLNLGFSLGTFKDIENKFNMASVATSDIIYKDDISNKPLEKFLRSEQAKIIITGNGTLRCEDKGLDAVNISPKGAILICANELNPRAIYSIDPGQADRVKVLKTYNVQQLENINKKHDYSVFPNYLFQELSNKYGVKECTLEYYFLRKCVDYLLNILNDKRNNHKNILHEEIANISSNLSFKLNKNASADIISFLLWGVSLIEVEENEKYIDWEVANIASIPWVKICSLIDLYKDLIFDTGVLEGLKNNYQKDVLQPIHPYVGLENLSPPHFRKALNDLSQKTYEELADPDQIEVIFKKFRPRNCTELQHDIGWLDKSYFEVKPSEYYIKTLAKECYNLKKDLSIYNYPKWT